MPRRGLPGVQVIVLIGVILLFVYGYYSFSELKSTLGKSEENLKRTKLEEENLSAQLQALTEQKNQLDESIKQDKEICRKEKDDLTRTKSELEMRCKQEKKLYADQVNSITEELNKMKANYETLRVQQQKHDADDSVHEQERQRLEVENNRLKQEARNEAAVLQDQIADLKRQNDALRKLVKGKLQDADKVAAAAGQHVADSHQESNVIPKDNVQQHWKGNNNRIPQMDDSNRQNVDNKEDENNQEVRMQINGPDQAKKLAYFEPKTAKPDHPVVANARPVNVNNADKPDANLPHAEQVAPPRVDDADDQNQLRIGEGHLAERLKRGAKARQNAVEAFGHPINPMMPAAAAGLDQRRDAGFAAAAGLDQRRDAGFAAAAGLDQRRDAGFVAAAGLDQHRDIGFAAAARKDSRIHPAQDNMDEFQNMGRGAEKPLQIAEPQVHQEEEDQLQGPGMRNQRNANDKEDAGDEGDENDEDYQYEDGRRDKAVKKDSVNGPHAAPVDEDEDNKDAGLR